MEGVVSELFQVECGFDGLHGVLLLMGARKPAGRAGDMGSLRGLDRDDQGGAVYVKDI